MKKLFYFILCCIILSGCAANDTTVSNEKSQNTTTTEPCIIEKHVQETDTPPIETEPQETESFTTAPLETAVPDTEPPAIEPPATDPPATEPPATEPPATEPPATEPPATEPPATEPPATEPPATEPPASEPDNQLTITIYIPDENTISFYTKTVAVDVLDPHQILALLIEHSMLNKGITLNSITIDGTQLNLDFNEAFLDQLVTYGTSGERMMIGCVVNTYLSAYGAETVYITVNGQVMESGHVIYDFPLGFYY